MTGKEGLLARSTARMFNRLEYCATFLLAATFLLFSIDGLFAQPALNQCQKTHAEPTVEQDSETTKSTFVIKISGEISVRTLYQIQYLLATIPDTERSRIARYKVLMDSCGGDLDQGIRIGRFFRQYRFRTIIPAGAECSSACALAFLGGTNEGSKVPIAFRIKSSTGYLGFHRFRLVPYNAKEVPSKDLQEFIDKSQTIMLKLLDYFIDMDVDPRILRHMINTPSDDMYYLDNAEALEYCIHIQDESLPPGKNMVSPYSFRYAVKPTTGRGWTAATCRYE